MQRSEPFALPGLQQMNSRRLVVWISAGILSFQGATLAFDLLNCTALSWLYLRSNGLPALEQQQNTPPATVPPEPPVSVFCSRPQGHIDEAVSQGLSILAGLALRSSVSGRGEGRP